MRRRCFADLEASSNHRTEGVTTDKRDTDQEIVASKGGFDKHKTFSSSMRNSYCRCNFEDICEPGDTTLSAHLTLLKYTRSSWTT